MNKDKNINREIINQLIEENEKTFLLIIMTVSKIMNDEKMNKGEIKDTYDLIQIIKHKIGEKVHVINNEHLTNNLTCCLAKWVLDRQEVVEDLDKLELFDKLYLTINKIISRYENNSFTHRINSMSKKITNGVADKIVDDLVDNLFDDKLKSQSKTNSNNELIAHVPTVPEYDAENNQYFIPESDYFTYVAKFDHTKGLTIEAIPKNGYKVKDGSPYLWFNYKSGIKSNRKSNENVKTKNKYSLKKEYPIVFVSKEDESDEIIWTIFNVCGIKYTLNDEELLIDSAFMKIKNNMTDKVELRAFAEDGYKIPKDTLTVWTNELKEVVPIGAFLSSKPDFDEPFWTIYFSEGIYYKVNDTIIDVDYLESHSEHIPDGEIVEIEAFAKVGYTLKNGVSTKWIFNNNMSECESEHQMINKENSSDEKSHNKVKSPFQSRLNIDLGHRSKMNTSKTDTVDELIGLTIDELNERSNEFTETITKNVYKGIDEFEK